MSADVLLNSCNELGKRDKIRGLPSILSLFRNEFNTFNNTEQNRTKKFYLDLSITSSSSQQYIIYKTYILRMHLQCN